MDARDGQAVSDDRHVERSDDGYDPGRHRAFRILLMIQPFAQHDPGEEKHANRAEDPAAHGDGHTIWKEDAWNQQQRNEECAKKTDGYRMIKFGGNDFRKADPFDGIGDGQQHKDQQRQPTR